MSDKMNDAFFIWGGSAKMVDKKENGQQNAFFLSLSFIPSSFRHNLHHQRHQLQHHIAHPTSCFSLSPFHNHRSPFLNPSIRNLHLIHLIATQVGEYVTFYTES